ncbi:MAG: DUF6946 family protein [Pseudomonadota bacterium]|jgi:hypothetical protein
MRLYDKKGREISDWRRWSPPKEDYQWRAGRSAMELARAWFTAPQPVLPPEVRSLLESRAETRGSELLEGWPEWVTKLPFPGEGRNHDLVAVGSTGARGLLLAVEGKVDEPFGDLVGSYWRKSKANSKSKAWKRIDTLLAAAFGPQASAAEKPWRNLRYQLLTALVGTAIEAAARECDIAVLCIHEFVTEAAHPDKLEKNHEALAAYLEALGAPSPKAGTLSGPFIVHIPDSEVPIPVLIGTAEYRWAAR